MAREDLTYELIAETCQQLFADGKHTSFDAVYDLIGRKGSAAKVRDYIKQWRQSLAELLNTPRASAVLPDALVGFADQLIEQIWTQALNQADSAYVERHQALEAERITWGARIDAAETCADDINRQLLIARGEIQAKEATIDGLAVQLGELRDKLATAVQVIANKEADTMRQHGELQALKTTLASERERHAEVLTAEQERHAAELKATTEAAEGLRKHLMTQTDEVRQAARQREQALQAQLAEQKEFADGFKRRATAAEDRIAEARGEAKALQSQINEQKAHADQLVGLLAVANANTAALHAQVAELLGNLATEKANNAEQARVINVLQLQLTDLQASAGKRLQGSAS
ncbi:DNA-binding protein [Dechloromonas hortensis]|uniref:DNA-binding protein n=1 Tax=Dechloromonas hortensis TaxID=337779 RepID=UPI001291680F|nr:DNA-binding protein [Dechloromonas hortensis]